MKRICAWCGRELEITCTEILNTYEDEITHGICVSCFHKMLKELKIDITEYSDKISFPIILIDRNLNVSHLNQLAKKLSDKPVEQIIGNAPGNALSCQYSFSSLGCGNTCHCTLCAIRTAIRETFEHEKELYRIPYRLVKNNEKILAYVSTFKLKEKVIISIEC